MEPERLTKRTRVAVGKKNTEEKDYRRESLHIEREN